MKIGTLELPIVSDVEPQDQANVTEVKDAFKHIDSTPVKHESTVDTIIITGFINEKVHSEQLSLSEQKKKLKSLRKSDIVENTINYRGFKGHLLIEDVSFSDSTDSRIINDVEITGRYFPWPKYYPESEP